jgi:hypothetical protein
MTKEIEMKTRKQRIEVHASRILAGETAGGRLTTSPCDWELELSEIHVNGAIAWATLLVDEIDKLEE